MKDSLHEALTTQKECVTKLEEKIDALSEKVGSPDISKAWIVGTFSLIGGVIAVCSSVLVVVISNADKIRILLGIGG